MNLPAPPRGVTAHAPHNPQMGELVRWRVDNPTGPWLELVLMEAGDGTRAMRVAVFPSSTPLITPNPGELECFAWASLAVSRWVAARLPTPAAPVEPDPTLFTLEVSAHG